MFQTLADPTRRRIVESLLTGERAANHIVDDVDIDQSGVAGEVELGKLAKS